MYRRCSNCGGWINLSTPHITAIVDGKKVYLHDDSCLWILRKRKTVTNVVHSKELIMCMLVSLFIGWNVITFCVMQPPPPPPKVIVVPVVPPKPASLMYDAEMASLKEI